VNDAELAVAAAEAGAAVVRDGYGRDLARVAKSAHDFATAADVDAERAIVGVLRSARPDDAVLGEESGWSGPPGASRVWLVDPLCGTLNYAARTPLVAVNVALRAASVVSVAAVADPFSGETFWTGGEGAYARSDGADAPLLPAAGSRLVDVNLDGPYPSRALSLLAHEAFASAFGPRVVSTTLAVAWVAAGRRAAYVTDGDLRDSVHFAAGIALCQAAGCVVTDLRGGSVLSDDGGLLAAADATTHAFLLDLVGRQDPSWHAS
jgi:myo-inositol-1(or 4)-monophosphatase